MSSKYDCFIFIINQSVSEGGGDMFRGSSAAVPRQPLRDQMWKIQRTRSTPPRPLSASTVWGNTCFAQLQSI